MRVKLTGSAKVRLAEPHIQKAAVARPAAADPLRIVRLPNVTFSYNGDRVDASARSLLAG